MPRAPSTHVNHSMNVEYSSSLATVPASRLRPATPTRRTRAGRSCRARAADFGHLRSHEEAYSGWRHTGLEYVGRGMARRSWPHAHTCATSPRWSRASEASASEASDDLSADEELDGDVTHHEEPMTCTVAMVEARPVRASSGCGQRACQVAARASDLQPSIGRGRSRHRRADRSRFDSVRKKVNSKLTSLTQHT